MQRLNYQDLLDNYTQSKECQLIEKITDARIRQKLHNKYAEIHIKTRRSNFTINNPWSLENIVRKYDPNEESNPTDDLLHIVELLIMNNNI